jgi:hypothetical protein
VCFEMVMAECEFIARRPPYYRGTVTVLGTQDTHTLNPVEGTGQNFKSSLLLQRRLDFFKED